jgi:hypothetical protein
MAFEQRSKGWRDVKSIMADVESSHEEPDSKAKSDHMPLPQVVISSEYSTHRDSAAAHEVADAETTNSLSKTSTDEHPEYLRDFQRNDQKEEEPIFHLAWDCDELIDKCLHQAQDEGSTVQTVLEQYRRSFDAWSRYLGVFAEEKTNLDRRLRRKIGIRNIVVRLLLILKQNLTQCKLNIKPHIERC